MDVDDMISAANEDEELMEGLGEFAADALTVLAQIVGKSECVVRHDSAIPETFPERRETSAHEAVPSKCKDAYRQEIVKTLEFKPRKKIKKMGMDDDVDAEVAAVEGGDDDSEESESGEESDEETRNESRTADAAFDAEMRNAPENRKYAGLWDEPVVHPLSFVVRRIKTLRNRSATSTFESKDRPLVSLECVSRAHEESYLRPPREGEAACSSGEFGCVGKTHLVHIADWPEGVPGFVLVAFSTPQENSGVRRRSTHGLCLLCLRRKVTKDWLEEFADDHPTDTHTLPYRVDVNTQGEYRLDAAILRNASGKFHGVAVPFVKFCLTKYAWDSSAETLRQRGVAFFDVAPSIFPIPFRRIGFDWSRAGEERYSNVGTEERAAELEGELEVIQAAMKRIGEEAETRKMYVEVARLELCLACDSVNSRPPTSPATPPSLIAFHLGRLFDLSHLIPVCGIFDRHPTEPLPVLPLTRNSRDSEFRTAMRNALPYVRKPFRATKTMMERAVKEAKDFTLVRWRAALVRCSLGGFYPRNTSRPKRDERTWLMEHFGHFPDETFARFSLDNLVTMAIREYVIYEVATDACLNEKVARIHPNWAEFVAHTTRLMDAARRTFSDCGGYGTVEDALVRMDAELIRVMNLVTLTPARRWFWEDAADHFDSLISPPGAMWGTDILTLKTFDSRFAYDRNVETTLREAAAVGYSERACEAVSAYARTHSLPASILASQSAIREAYEMCMFVRDSFRVRVIRAPRHWRFPFGDADDEELPKEFLGCVKCRKIGENVLYDVHLDRFFCADKRILKKKGTHSICDRASRCVNCESLGIPLYGNIVEFFGRLVTLCTSCGANPAYLSEETDVFESVCSKCAEAAEFSTRTCEICKGVYRRSPKRPWTRVLVFKEPKRRKEVWFCPAEKCAWVSRRGIWSYPLLMRALTDPSERR